MKGQPLPAPLPRIKVPPHHQARLAALAGFCSWSFSPNLERTLVHSQAWCVPTPSQVRSEQPLAQHSHAGGDGATEQDPELLSSICLLSAKEAKPLLAPV